MSARDPLAARVQELADAAAAAEREALLALNALAIATDARVAADVKAKVLAAFKANADFVYACAWDGGPKLATEPGAAPVVPCSRCGRIACGCTAPRPTFIPVAACSHESQHFDRSLCACGSMHTYCNDCGALLDHCSLDDLAESARIGNEPLAADSATPVHLRKANARTIEAARTVVDLAADEFDDTGGDVMAGWRNGVLLVLVRGRKADRVDEFLRHEGIAEPNCAAP